VYVYEARWEMYEEEDGTRTKSTMLTYLPVPKSQLECEDVSCSRADPGRAESATSLDVKSINDSQGR
jgi:hypothetical protein